MFYYFKHGISMFLLIYVDDNIVVSLSDAVISALLSDLHSEFALKDLGDLRYFLGIEVTPTNDGQIIT